MGGKRDLCLKILWKWFLFFWVAVLENRSEPQSLDKKLWGSLYI